MEDNALGINLRPLLCGNISLFEGDLKIYKERNILIDEVERRIKESDWLSLSDGTTFTKTFVPSRNANLLDVVKANGYKREGYGYKRKTENNIHWIILLPNGALQMHAYDTEDDEMEIVYSTGTIAYISCSELQLLITMFMKHHS